MIALLISIPTGAIMFYLGFRVGRADGERRAAFEDAWKRAGK